MLIAYFAKEDKTVRKPTTAQIEVQKTKRAVKARGEIKPIEVPEEKPLEKNEETAEERRKRWDKTWGETANDADCRKLDNTYDMIAEEYRPNITSRLEINLRDIAKIRLLRDKAIEEGNSSAVRKNAEPQCPQGRKGRLTSLLTNLFRQVPADQRYQGPGAKPLATK